MLQPRASRPASTRRLAGNRRRGIVLIMTLLAVILLAGMVMFVINLGRSTTRRIVVQNAADSAAISGAGWVARSLNTVSMNNVNMAMLLTLVDVVDALPDATRITINEHEATVKAMRATSGISDSWVRDQINDLVDELNGELAILKPMNDQFNSYDVRNATFYNGPSGRGQFWAAMEGLDELNQATMEKLGELAQINARAGGEANLARVEGSKAAFLAPVLPQIPWQRGQFDDFQRPVLNGLLPDKIDNKEFNRGPWDTLYGFRQLIGGGPIGYWVGGGGGPPASSGRGSVPIGSGAGGGGGGGGHFVQTGYTEPHAYQVHGFYGWLMAKIHHFASENLPHGRFTYWHDRLSSIKFRYLWPGTGPQFLIDPEFETDFNKAVQIATDDPKKIKETWFIAVEMKSKYERGKSGFLSPGSYSFFVSSGQSDRNTPRTVRMNGWVDPRPWEPPAKKVGEHAWRDEWEYTTYFDPTIGIQAIRGANGAYVAQKAYRIDTFIFMGVNIGEEFEVRNPNNFTSRSGLPAPTDLDHAQLSHDNAQARRDKLNFLAIAQVHDAAIAWPSRFTGLKPYPFQVGVAQAHVFNNHSWDLWTQMWEAQLRPTDHFDHWAGVLESTGGDLPAEVPPQLAEEVAKYLKSIRAMSDLWDDAGTNQ